MLMAGVVAGSFSIGRSVPQIIKLVRTGSALGVSVAMWCLSLAASVLWLSWSVINGDPVNLVVNVLGAVGSALVVRALYSSNRLLARRWMARSALLCAGALGPDLFVPGALSLCAVLVSCAMFVPQLRAAVREHQMTGVSSATWAMTALSALAWVAYGAGRHTLAVVAPNLVVLPMAVFILGCKADRSGRLLALGRAASALVGGCSGTRLRCDRFFTGSFYRTDPRYLAQPVPDVAQPVPDIRRRRELRTIGASSAAVRSAAN